MRAVQFHPLWCPEAKGAPVEQWDTSHDLSVIDDSGRRVRIGTFKHARWAARVGELIEKHGLEAAE